jgi:hypothetical protein
VLRDQFAVDAGLVVVAFEVRLRREGDEILVSFEIPRQQQEVVGLVVAPFAALARSLGDVGLHADDGLDATVARLAVEVDRPVEGAVVGHGHGFHAELLHAVHQGRDFRHAVEERILGMSV